MLLLFFLFKMSHGDRILFRPSYESVVCPLVGVAASQDQDFGTANLHVEVSDVVSVLVYVGVAKGNGVLSKTGKTDHRYWSIKSSDGLYLFISQLTLIWEYNNIC